MNSGGGVFRYDEGYCALRKSENGENEGSADPTEMYMADFRNYPKNRGPMMDAQTVYNDRRCMPYFGSWRFHERANRRYHPVNYQ